MHDEMTALILIGFQNDYFAKDGLLHSAIEDESLSAAAVAHTVELLTALRDTKVTIIATPVRFTADYAELVDPVGMLAMVKTLGAFRDGSAGAQTIPELREFGDRILEIPGKRGLNAFSNTALAQTLEQRKIEHVVVAGALTSVCIDSTGRHAFETGYRVTILSDCTCGRTAVEQQFYCEKIFPLYANVATRHDLQQQLQG